MDSSTSLGLCPVEQERPIEVLFIDQEHDRYVLISEYLRQIRSIEYKLSWCFSYEQALDEVLSEKYDVVLLDYFWDNYSGAQILKNARSEGCQVPIVVMTEMMDDEVDKQAISDGASDYLIKGNLNAQVLERTIRYAMERKAVEQRLARLAHYDALTDIPNRILFRDRLEHAIKFAERNHTPLALMYLDLDGFKDVNDSFGHHAGDDLIQQCAQRLADCVRRSDSVARIGGDEFTLLLEQSGDTGDLAAVAGKVLEVICEPFQIDSHQVVIGCSIGIAVYPQAGEDADTLQKNADVAMYRAKELNGSCYRFFTEDMNRQVRQQLVMESDLRRSLRREEFALEYQPRVNIRTGEIIGAEALVRWHHPQKGLLNPSDFIPIAEASGLIIPLGYWILQRACQDLALMAEHQHTPITLAINLSLRQFRDAKLAERIERILAKTGVLASNLEFEITETAVMENMAWVQETLMQLSELDVRFSLDDFGTGYSSFVHLQRLPIEILKIDRSFIGDIASNKQDANLVRAMINLAHSLGKQIVAEGVESKEQLDLLRNYGCDEAQGYYLSQPVGINDLLVLLRKGALKAPALNSRIQRFGG